MNTPEDEPQDERDRLAASDATVSYDAVVIAVRRLRHPPGENLLLLAAEWQKLEPVSRLIHRNNLRAARRHQSRRGMRLSLRRRWSWLSGRGELG